eukprot:364806-Chlamydomonas_euryale.AAC.9
MDLMLSNCRQANQRHNQSCDSTEAAQKTDAEEYGCWAPIAKPSMLSSSLIRTRSNRRSFTPAHRPTPLSTSRAARCPDSSAPSMYPAQHTAVSVPQKCSRPAAGIGPSAKQPLFVATPVATPSCSRHR